MVDERERGRRKWLTRQREGIDVVCFCYQGHGVMVTCSLVPVSVPETTRAI